MEDAKITWDFKKMLYSLFDLAKEFEKVFTVEVLISKFNYPAVTQKEIDDFNYDNI